MTIDTAIVTDFGHCLQHGEVELISALNREGVRFMLIGGAALILRGVRNLNDGIKDLDFLYSFDSTNCERVNRALTSFFANNDSRFFAPSAREFSVPKRQYKTVYPLSDFLATKTLEQFDCYEKSIDFVEIQFQQLPVASVPVLIDLKKEAVLAFDSELEKHSADLRALEAIIAGN